MSTVTNKLQILSHEDVVSRIRRMGYEIYERNYTEEEVTLIGIDERGGYIAEQLAAVVKEISPLKVARHQVDMEQLVRAGKTGPLSLQITTKVESLSDKVVIVVDDVLYGGNTMLNVVSHLLEAAPRKIQTAVLIDRGHRLMPIAPNYVGMELATSIQEFISFEVNEAGNASAYVFDKE